MGKMCRLKPEAAAAFALQEALPHVTTMAQQMGLPMTAETTQMLRQLLHTGLLAGLSECSKKYGLFTGITDESPHFQHFGAYALVNSMQNARPIANVTPPVAQPAQVPQTPVQMPQVQQPQFSHIPPPPAHAIMPGQPLPANLSPAHVQVPQPQQQPRVPHPLPAHQVPVHAPVLGNGDHPPSLTNMPDPTPQILQ